MTAAGRAAAVVGTGYIGGSIARGLRDSGAWREVVGWDAEPAHRDVAKARGLVDRNAAGAGEAARDAALVVVAVPIGAMDAVFHEIAPTLAPDAVVLDIASVKERAVEAARALPRPERFVGAHPIAGLEHNGPEAADGGLFRGRWVVLTPTAVTDATAVAMAETVWRHLGAHIKKLDARAHDRLFAKLSHVPHAVAFALARLLREEPDELLRLAGNSILDETRVAGSPSPLWAEILAENGGALLAVMEELDSALAAIRRAVEERDLAGLIELLDEGRRGRDKLVRAREPAE